MYKLHELEKWIVVPKPGLKFTNDKQRNVRLEVLSESMTALFVILSGKRYFIGLFEGYDVVEFEVPGVWNLEATGGPVKVWTPEAQVIAEARPEAVSFTKIMTRRTRNPEMERMMQKVHENMERRIAQVTADVSLVLSNERRRAEANAAAEKLDDDKRKATEDAARVAAERAAEPIEPGPDPKADKTAKKA